MLVKALELKPGMKIADIGEHLGPLYRYLRGQVGRPWDKVYGELCAGLDRRSVVQAHLFQHIGDRVAIDTTWHDGELWVNDWRGRQPLARSRAEMFVHPVTGILLVNKARVIARRNDEQSRLAQARAREQERRIGAPLPPDVQWHRIDGLWFEVRIRHFEPGTDVPAYDVVLRRTVGCANHTLLRERYGARHAYAHAKRQLDAKTLRRHGLANA